MTKPPAPRRPRAHSATPAAARHAAAEPAAGQRIAKLLARAGIASRREIERMIAEGRIAIDGKTLDTPATILTSLRGVTVDGQPVKEPAPARLFVFHKPAGCLTAERDPAGRPTIYDRLPAGLPRLVPVGRLDYNTEGLLLLTTDGELKRALELPATGVERTYRARAFGEVSQAQLEALFDGIEIDGMRYGPIDANLERRTGRNQWVEMKLREGKNREVRRVLEHLGLEVSRLIRTAYGPFRLGDLPVGGIEEVRRHDLVVFRQNLDTKGGPDRMAPIYPRRREPEPLERAPAPAAASAVEPDRPRRVGKPAAPRPVTAKGPGPARSPRPERNDERPARPGRAPRGELAERPERSSRAGRPPREQAERPQRSAKPGARSARPGLDARPSRPKTGPRGPATGGPRPGSPKPSGSRPGGRPRGRG